MIKEQFMDKKLRENLILNSLYQILAIFVPLITAPYLGRILKADQIGTYTFVHSIVSYFSHFAMLGIMNYGSREIAKVRDDKNARSKVFCEIYAMQVLTAGVSVIVYVIYAFLSHTEYQLITKLMIIWTASNLLDVGWYCTGMEQFRTIVKRNILIKCLNIVLILTLVRAYSDLNIYTIIMAGCQLLSQIIISFVVIKDVKISLPKFSEVWPRFKPNFLLFLPTIAATVYQVMDKIMIGAISSKVDLAYYEYADKIIQVPLLIFGAMGTVMLSRMSNVRAKADDSEAGLLSMSMDLSMVLASIFAFGLASVSVELVDVYYGDGFHPSGLIMLMLTPVIFLNGWANVLRMQYVIPRGLDSIYVKATIAGAIVNLIINFIFIPRYGSVGAAIGTIIAQIVVTLVFTVYSRKDLPLKTYFKNNIPFILIGILMFIIVKLVQFLHSENLIGLAIDILVGGSFYVLASAIVSKRYPNHIIGSVFNKLNRKKSS